MMISKKLYFYIKFFVFFIGLSFLLHPPSAYAVFFFADGNPRVFTDEQGGDEFFGATDLTIPASPAVVQSTDMTFNITQGNPDNTINIISGGFLGTDTRGGTVTGNVNIRVFESTVNYLAGAGFTTGDPRNPNAGPPTIIGGDVNIFVRDSTVAQIVGGGWDNSGTVGQHVGHTGIRGSVNIRLVNADVNTLLGSSQTVGLQDEGRIAVFGNVNIWAESGSIIQHLIGTSDMSAHIKGNLSISIKDSQVIRFDVVDHAVVLGNIFVDLDNADIGSLILTTESGYGGTAEFLIRNNTQVGNVDFGPVGGFIPGGLVRVRDDSFVRDMRVTGGNGSIMKDVLFDIGDDSYIANVFFTPPLGSIVNNAKLLVSDRAHIEEVQVGSQNGGKIDVFSMEVSGGIIDNINHSSGVNFSTLMFVPGNGSSVKRMSGTDKFSRIMVMKDARTIWGIKGQKFSISGNNIDLGGTVVIPNNTTFDFFVGNRLLANGGTFEITDEHANRTTEPFMYFYGDPGASVEVVKPLKISLDASPEYLQKDIVMLARVTPNLANPDLFESSNRTGLIWTGVFFDSFTNTWFLNNFEISKDYYGYSSARSASSWLRQKHIGTIQNRSVQALLDKHDGFWGDVQSGYEKIDITTGKSKTLWVMTSVGYDYNHELTKDFTAVYGGALGFNFGDNKWKLYNTVKNRIMTGLLSGYAGITLNSGLYTVGTVQLSIGNTRSKNPGFFTTNKWTEIVPTESLELGWRFRPHKEFTITPRAQAILEHIPKNSISFTCITDKEKVSLTKTTVLTTVLGLNTAYDFKVLTVHLGVDWIKGMAGEYSVHSQFFDKKFKEKNNNSVIRTSLGCDVPVIENMDISANVFADVIDNKGFGAQVNCSYKF